MQPKYDAIRAMVPGVFPSYKTVQRAKKDCYPKRVVATDSSCGVPVGDLVGHTVSRILETVDPSQLEQLDDKQGITFKVKVGMDGSGGLTKYKQDGESLGCDGTVFISAMEILGSSPEPIWTNPKPNSSLWCRLIRYKYVKETEEVIRAEKAYLEKEFSKINDKRLQIKINDSKYVYVILEVDYTMIDGKVANVLTGCSSSKSCNIGKLGPTDFNNLEKVMSTLNGGVDEQHYCLWLSTLHTWIRALEWMLHLSYKLKSKKYGVTRTEEELATEKARTVNIQDKFKEQLHLLIDMPTQNFGSTNDGNASRKVFKNYKLSAEILELDERIVKNLQILC